MKYLKTITYPKVFTYSIVLLTFLLNLSACLVVHESNNGRHRGWYKNSNNPHHPNTTNPGNGNGNGRGHSKH